MFGKSINHAHESRLWFFFRLGKWIHFYIVFFNNRNRNKNILLLISIHLYVQCAYFSIFIYFVIPNTISFQNEFNWNFQSKIKHLFNDFHFQFSYLWHRKSLLFHYCFPDYIFDQHENRCNKWLLIPIVSMFLFEMTLFNSNFFSVSIQSKM